MIDMASIVYGKKHDEPQDKQTNKKARRKIGKNANKKEDKQAKRQTKRWCPRGTNVGLDRMSITSLCWKHGRHTSKQDSCMNM